MAMMARDLNVGFNSLTSLDGVLSGMHSLKVLRANDNCVRG